MLSDDQAAASQTQSLGSSYLFLFRAKGWTIFISLLNSAQMFNSESVL